MYCSNCGKNIGEQPVFCQFCGTRVAQMAQGFPPVERRPFTRLSGDKKIAGVCAGVARYFDLDVTIVRAVWLLCVLLGGCGLIAYVVLWIVMPLEPAYPMLPA